MSTITFDPDFPVSFDSLTTAHEKRPSCNVCKLVGGLLGRGAALLFSPFSMCARSVRQCLSQVLCKRVELGKRMAPTAQPKIRAAQPQSIMQLLEQGAYRMDDDRWNACRRDGLLPPIARKYFEELSLLGDQSTFVRAIRDAHPKLEEDLWASSDFHLDARGQGVISNETARNFFMEAIREQNEHVLQAYARIGYRFDKRSFEEALAEGCLISASWMLKAGIGLSSFHAPSQVVPQDQTAEARLRKAIHSQNTDYISAQRQVLDVSYPMQVDREIESDGCIEADQDVSEVASGSIERLLRENSKNTYELLVAKGYNLPPELDTTTRLIYENNFDVCVLLLEENYPMPPRAILTKKVYRELIQTALRLEKAEAFKRLQSYYRTGKDEVYLNMKEKLIRAAYLIREINLETCVQLIEKGHRMPPREMLTKQVYRALIQTALRLDKAIAFKRLQDYNLKGTDDFTIETEEEEELPLKYRREYTPTRDALRHKKYSSCVCLLEAGYPMPAELLTDPRDYDQLMLAANLLRKPKAIQRLIDYRCDVSHQAPPSSPRGEIDWDMLFDAIDSENIPYLQDRTQKTWFTITPELGDPAAYALKHGKYNAFVCLINLGYKMPSFIDDKHLIHLVCAARRIGNRSKIEEKLLLAHNKKGIPPQILKEAIDNDNILFLSVLKKVLGKSIHPDTLNLQITDCGEEIPLVRYAAQCETYGACVCLIDAGFPTPVNLGRQVFSILYSHAKRMGKKKVVNYLDAWKIPKEEILRHAIDEESLEYLASKKVLKVTFDDLSPTEYALRRKKFGSFVCLLEAGYPMPENLRGEDLYDAVICATRLGKTRLANRLKDLCRDIHTSPDRGTSIARNLPILMKRAIDENDRALLQGIHRVKLYCPDQVSPIMYALKKGNQFAVSCLINIGGYSFSDEVLKPELYWEAAANKHTVTLKLLLDRKIPIPRDLVITALQNGWFESAAMILTHLWVMEKIPHPFHWAMEQLNHQYNPDLGKAFNECGLDPLDRDASGRSFLRIVMENGDELLFNTLLYNVGNLETEGHKKELAKVVEELAKDGTLAKITKKEKNGFIFRALDPFGESTGPRVVGICQHLEDLQVLRMLPEIDLGYNAQTTDEIVKAFDAKLEAELNAFEVHAKGLALEPLGQTVANMVRLELGLKAILKLLNQQQSEVLKTWVKKIGELLKEAGSIETFLGKMQELGVTTDRTEEDFQRIGKWMATLKKDDLPLLRAGLKYFGKAEWALVYLYEYVEDKELIQESLKEFGAEELNEFGRKLAYRLGCTVSEFNRARGKTSQVNLMPLLTEMTKLGNFAKQMKGLDSKVHAEIQAQALKARACNPAFQVADDFAALLKSAGITGHDIGDRRRIVDLIPLLENGEVLPMLNGKRGHMIEQLLSYLDGDLYRGILSFYPFFHNMGFLTTLPSLNGSLLQGVDSFIAARLAALKKKENIPELLKLLLLWQALKPLRPKPYNIPLNKELAEKVFELIEQNLRIGMADLPITPAQLKNMQEQHHLAVRLVKLLSKDDQRILAELSDKISRSR
ncbi:MAG TPA: hypothetical protein VLG44_06350 [Chlamydiales bacterium]|nr:hypothetical protein [Chlamydiales bacterium]